MKRLCLTSLFFFIICTFAFAQDDAARQDSLALVDIYRYAHFKTPFKWDLDMPVQTWHGVTLNQSGRVERLELSGTMTGSYCCFSNSGNMSELTHIDLSNNNLKYIPNMQTAPKLAYINVANNQLNFNHLMQRLPLGGAQLVYAPQTIIDEDLEIRVFIDTDYSIYVPYSSHEDDVFVWYKDGVQISTTTEKDLGLTNIKASDAGAYTLNIKNVNFPNLTIQAGPYLLSVGGARERDSLALVRFYDDCQFKSEAQKWDLSQPIDTWYGVTLSPEGCVERIELPAALTRGYLPYNTNLADLTCLTHLDLRENNIIGIRSVLDIPNLNYLNVQDNALDLYDLMPFVGNEPQTFIYHPQNTIDAWPNTIIDKAGSDMSVTVDISTYQDPNNTFKWYQNGVQVASFIDYRGFQLNNLQPHNSGTYICEITNPVLPDLTLYSEPIEVLVMPDGRALDSLVLTFFEETATFKPGHGWNLTQPMNTWEGVTLNAEGRVQELILPNVFTQAVFVPRMHQLEDLEVIDLSHNNLTGSFLDNFPADYYSRAFPKLKYADLSHNQLTGRVGINSLSNPEVLEYLDCSDNQIDRFFQINRAVGLSYLDISNNPLTNSWDTKYYWGVIPKSNDLEVLRMVGNNFPLRRTDDTDYNFNQLRVVELQNNKISKLLPEFFNSSVDSLNVTYNQLTFEDLIRPNTPASYMYAPQDTIGEAYTVRLTPGSNYTIYNEFDEDVQNNTYTWYKDGNLLSITTEGVLPFTNLQATDAGNYTCQVTNSALSDLTLYTAPVTIIIDQQYSNCRLRDSLALVQIGSAEVNGGNPQWDFSRPLEQWNGVVLSEQGCVVNFWINDDHLLYIPSAIGQLLDVESISFSENGSSGSIPRTVGNLTKLRHLGIGEQEYVDGSIPIELATLPNLETLRIERYIDEIPSEIGNATSLKTLEIGGGFTELPSEIGQLTNLVNLSLWANLTTLPTEMTNLTKLRKVDFRNNQLTYLPPNLAGNWMDLEDISLENNQLTYDDLLQFKDFNFGNQNTIGTPDTVELIVGDDFMIDLGFDTAITDNTYHWFRNSTPIDTTTQNQLTLTNIQLDDTGIYTCKVYNPALPNYVLNTAPITLNEIYANCRLRDSLALVSIMDGYCNWDVSKPLDEWYIIKLSAEGCVTEFTPPEDCLGELSPAIGQMLDLEYIDLDENGVDVIPATIGALTKLRYLDISDNMLTSPIPLELTTLPNLEMLNLSSNNISEIPIEISNMASLKTLVLASNNISEIPSEIGNMTSLEQLLLGRNSIAELPVEIGNLTSLTKLDVSYNDITELPVEIGNLASLTFLNIDLNPVEELPVEIGNLSNLQLLNIGRTKITNLPATVSNLTNLRRLNAYSSQLDTLRPNLAESWPNLNGLQIETNYLTFDDLIQFTGFGQVSSQRTIGTPDTVELVVGADFVIDLGFDEGITSNTYEWFRNSIPIETTTQNRLVLPNVQSSDAGIYTCKVFNPAIEFNNPAYPDYSINAAPVTLIVDDNAPDSPVYPGDASANGIVNCVDALFWGLAKGNAGPVRPDASAIWTPQPAPDWNSTIVGINGKHQDCDGSGLVDEADLDIIEVNYLKTNADYQQQFHQDNALQISPQIIQAQNFAASSEYELEINLESSLQGTTTIHGLSFSIDLSGLNSAKSYRAELTNTNSWLAPSNVISIHDDYAKRSGFALTRSDLKDKTGIGSIGTAIIISENLPTADTPQFRVIIRDITAVQSDGTLLHGEDVFIGAFGNSNPEAFIPQIAFEAIAYAATCDDPSSATVTVTSGTPPYQYQWSNGDTNATAENLVPGEYEVTITDNFGQNLTGSVIVPDGAPLPDIELQTNTDGQIEIVSNRPDIQYEWNGVSGTNLQDLTPGEHTLTISDSLTCSKTVSVWVADIYANVILEGAYDDTLGLMNDGLRRLGLIPLTDPYTGRMTTTNTVLQVTGNSAIVDWVLLELHDKNTKGKVIASYPALLRRDGLIVANDGINAPRIAVPEETDYYLMVKHRNHLPVKSGAVVSMAQIAVSQSFEQGNASRQKEMNDGTYAAFAGDIITDHTIDGSDKILWEPMNGTFNQYHAADTNLDGDISGADKGVWFTNNGTFTDIE